MAKGTERGHASLSNWIVFAFCLLLAQATLHAQTFYASISGVVTDPSGAVVSKAAVMVIDTATSTAYKTVTNGSGSYHVSFLKPSQYVVEVQKAGFQDAKTRTIALVLNQAAIVDVKLTLGSEAQTITVSAAATVLNDTNSQIAGELNNAELIDLPESTGSKGANEFLLTKVFAGASSTSQDYSNVNNLSLGGGRPVSNPIIIDGLPSNMGVDGTYGLIPTPDSTEELQVLTSPFSAQYGQSGGGAILTNTKSGTDRFHGTAFESYSSQDLSALNYFTAPGTVINPSFFHYFGGSLGGPARIPHVFSGKRRLYFFTDWEYTLQHANSPFDTTVPTAQELTGDFSGTYAQGGTSPVIYDPQSTKIVGGKVVRTAFANNVIPTARIDQIGRNVASFFPKPNCSLGSFNYCVTPIAVSTYLYNADRIDADVTDNDHVWAKFSRDGPRNQAVNDIPNAANVSAPGGWTDDHYAISWNHIVSPNMSNEARAGYVWEGNFSTPAPADASAIGLQGVPLTQFPKVSTNQFASFGAGGYSRTRDGHFILNDALSMALGHHSLSVGAEFMRYAYSVYSPGVLSGSYTFNGTFTSGNGQSGVGLADLLLGLPSNTNISTNNTIFQEHLNYFATYIQDDYRITPKLTVNLGLRWEFDGPYSEVHNNMYSFNPNIVDPVTQKPGGIEFAGSNGAPHSLVANVYTGILPRAGFSYRLFPNTVVRGGYGIFELPSIGYGTVGLTSASTVNATFQSADGVTPAYELNQGVPPYSANVGPNGLPLIPTSPTKPTFSPVERQLTPVLPYLQEWQFGLQQNLGGSWVAEVDYEGNHGVHMPVNLPINQIQPTPNCCYGAKNAQSLRPYPQFLTVSYLTNGGASAYAALLANLRHEWKQGISVQAAYTWAHTLDDVDGTSRADAAPIQNVYNLHQQWGTAMISIPQRFSLSMVDALPFGAGSRILNQTPVLSQVIGHWKVSTVAQFQMGYPYNVSQGDTLGLFSGGQYVTKVGNPSLDRGSRTVQKWFNTAAFATTAPNAFGNAPRASLYGPGQNVWDISLMRDIPIGERMRVTFRADAHNAFNHPQFSGLGTSITTPKTFGTVTGAQDPRTLLLVGRLTF